MTEMETQFLAPAEQPDEDELDRSLRPRSLDEFVGQERVKEQLAIALEATRSCLHEQMRSGLESLKSALVEEPRPADRGEVSRPLSRSNS